MKNKKIIISSIAALFSLCSVNFLSNQKNNEAKAVDDWNIIDTKIEANYGLYMLDASDSYIYFKYTPSDMPSSHVYVGNTPYYSTSDYNFLSHILLSNDKVNYIPFSTIRFPSLDFNHFSNDGFRLGRRRNADTIEEDGSYRYIKILKGCELPSYDYCLNGGTKKKYVQTNEVICELTTNDPHSSYVRTYYSEYATKPKATFTGIAPGWNDVNYGSDPKYHQLILCFGTHEVDYLANNHTPNSTNRATSAYDTGTGITIDDVPIYKINGRLNKTHIGYDHGYEYLYFNYPIDILNMNKNNPIPTLHIEEGTEFMDVLLPELTLKYAGGQWINTSVSEFVLTDPLDFFNHTIATPTPIHFPHRFGTEAHAVLRELPINGCQLGFNIDTGDIDLNNGNNAFVIDGLYKCSINIYLSSGTIQLVDKEASNTVVATYSNFIFKANTTYIFEFDISCGTKTTFKMAIDHYLLFDYTFNRNKSEQCNVWFVDTSGQLVMDLYENLIRYQPEIDYGGSSSYDFVAGDPLYNFTNVVNAFNLYDDNVSFSDLEFIYEDGAVTNGKYNEGVWTLTIKLALEGYPVVTKEITINVHGDTSIAKIYFDDNEPIEVPVGSKLIAPPNPETYREGDYDYVFEGWYFEGAKWDFENDVVEGDMHLESRFIKQTAHYIVTAIYEGISRKVDTFSLVYGASLPFDLFAVDGATFEVYLGNDKIISLTVTANVTIHVKYNVSFTYVPPKEGTYSEDGNVGYWYSPVYEGYYFADSRGTELIDDPIIPKKGTGIPEIDDNEFLLFTPSDYNLTGNDTNPYYGDLGDVLKDSFAFQFNVNIPSSDFDSVSTDIRFGATNIYGSNPTIRLLLNDSTYRFGMFFNNSFDWTSWSSSPTWTPDVDHKVEFYAIKVDDTHMVFILLVDGSLIWKTAPKDISGVNFDGHTFIALQNNGSSKKASYYSSIPTLDTALDKFTIKYMHSVDIPTDDTRNTGACLGNDGYYQKAKNYYVKYLTPTQKNEFVNNSKYDSMRNRFIAWAFANGEIVGFDSHGALTSVNNDPINFSDYSMIIVISISFVLASFCIYLFTKRRKTLYENK